MVGACMNMMEGHDRAGGMYNTIRDAHNILQMASPIELILFLCLAPRSNVEAETPTHYCEE